MSIAKTKTARKTARTKRATRPKEKSGKAGKSKSKGKIQVLTSADLDKIPWLLHGFSTRCGGFSKGYGGSALNLGVTKDDTTAAVERNRAAFLRVVGAPEWPIVQMRQVHSDIIHRVDGLEGAKVRTALGSFAVAHGTKQSEQQVPFMVGDGLVTDASSLLLAVKTADCMPVMLVDPKRHAVGIFHAGWRGTLRRIVQKGVGEMHRWYKSDPKDLLAVLGPSIRNCCYSVGEEVRDKFIAQFAYGESLFREWQTYEDIHLKYPLLFLTMRAPGHSELPYRIFLDLAEANRRQLLDAGMREQNITVLPGCTACDTKTFFSHRKENGVTGRMMAVVGIRAVV